MNQRKTIALALAAFILIPLMLSGGLQVFQIFLRYRALYRLQHESLVTIRVLAPQVQWVEEDEVMIDGKMFDLKTFSEEGGVFAATGVWDEKETRVMSWLHHFNESKQEVLLIRLLILCEIFFALVLGFASLNRYSLLRSSFNYFSSLRAHPFVESQFPPPKMLFVSSD